MAGELRTQLVAMREGQAGTEQLTYTLQQLAQTLQQCVW
jgi:hypothetical protein